MSKLRMLAARFFPWLRSREFYAETFDFQSGLDDSACLLYDRARSLRPQACVEIGSARGKSAGDIGVPRFVDELRAAGHPVITIDQNFGVSMVQPRIGGEN